MHTHRPIITLSPTADGAKLHVSANGLTRTVTTVRPARTAEIAAALLDRIAALAPSHVLHCARRTGGETGSIRRDVLARYADGLAGRPISDCTPAEQAAHQLGAALADTDAPVHTAVRTALGDLFTGVPDLVVTAEITDYTGDLAATVDITAAFADGDPEQVAALLNSAASSPADTSVLFDTLTGAGLTTVERVVTRIEATGSPVYLDVDLPAARRWLAAHRPDLLTGTVVRPA